MPSLLASPISERPLLLRVVLTLVSEIVRAKAESVRSHETMRAASLRRGSLPLVMSGSRNAPRQPETSPTDPQVPGRNDA